MPVIIGTKSGEKTYTDKNIINVGSHPNCDVIVKIPVKFVLTVEVLSTGGYKVTNRLSSPEVLFRGQPMGAKLMVEKACKLMIAGTDEFVSIKTPVTLGQSPQNAERASVQQTTAATARNTQQVQSQAHAQAQAQRPVRRPQQPQVTMTSIAEQDFDEDDIRELYGDKVNAATKIKLDKRKADIEMRRVSIIKEIAYALQDSKKKMTANGNAEKFLVLALIACPVIMSAAVSDTLYKMVMDSSMTRSFFPLHMRLLAGYAILLFVTGLILKQGVFLHLQERLNDAKLQKTGAVAKTFMLLLSSVIFFVIGIIILVFYFDPSTALEQGQTIVSMISLFTLILCSICGGYFKSTATEAALQYDKYENREDFKKVLQDYQQWIGLYINNLSSVKLKNIKDKQFGKNIKSWGEYALGIATSPFLAFGVSNTLAMCFPEAAGWIRISGLRLSPVFLVLATVMIVFAFFTLTSFFVTVKQVNGAEVIKNDGFNNYVQHGVDLFGTEAVKKIKSDGLRCLMIALSIIFIEFTMNVSYFMQEIGGGEWSGIFLSIVAALVPTALLVAETLLLSHTLYEIHTYDEILSRLDKEIE